MAKKREFASDSDVSRFITRKQNHEDEHEDKRQQFTIYPDKNLLEQVKILSKLKDISLNNVFINLVQESLKNEEYQKLIKAYQQMKELI